MQKTISTVVNKYLPAFIVFALVLGSLSISALMARAAPLVVVTDPATSVTATDATLNGTNGDTAGSGSSFWISTSTFDTSSPTIPAGVYSTADFGAIAADAAFMAPLSSIANILPVTPGTTYYVAAWSNVDGTWIPGAVMHFVTSALTLPGALAAQDFGTMNVSNVNGYTAGFGLTDATLAGATSVVVRLYSGTTLLQTNTATTKLGTDFPTATSFSSPFDVYGTFNYATDGYWNNVRAAEYGQTLIPTSVTATVTLANGKVVTATNSTMTGDPIVAPTTPSVTTLAATGVLSTDATLNGRNGPADASGHSFWASLATFDTTSPVVPAGVYTTDDLGAITANTAFTAPLSDTGIPDIAPNTTYYVAAWSFVDGTWYPGAVMHFTTAVGTSSTGTIGGTVTNSPGVLAVTSVTPVQTAAISDGTYANGWSYLFNITVPTNETNLSMEFGNWLNSTDTILAAGNMQISSAQAVASTTPVTITAPNTFSTPALAMIGDLSSTLAGLQVQVLVQTKIPLNSANGSYTTSYGVQTLH